jgi:DNA-binding GntR family transcriptional regulator
MYVCTRNRSSVQSYLGSTNMTIDPTADRPVYKQLADLVRSEIDAGRYVAGQRLPAETDLAQQHGISRDSVRKAMAVLRSEGRIVTRLRGSYVRDRGEITTVGVVSGATIEARMPTPDERRQFGIAEGTPVLVVTVAGREPDVYPADSTVLRVKPPA